MSGFAKHRCRLHAGREAAARCPSCGGYFCRECVSEHDGRVLCAACIARDAAAPAVRGFSLAPARRAAAALAGLAFVWLLFSWMGRLLLRGSTAGAQPGAHATLPASGSSAP